MTIATLFEAFGLPAASLKLATGDLGADLPQGFTTPIAGVIAHPPAFVPLCSQANGTFIGWWVDPIGPRASSIVVCDPSQEYRVTEQFRTWDQLAFHLVLAGAQSSGLDGARALANELSVDVGAAGRVAASGMRPGAMHAIACFAQDPPWLMSPASYRGEWPFPARLQSGADLRFVSGLELTVDQQRAARTDVETPPWLATRLPSTMFSRLCVRDNYNGAWRCLNSPGWGFAHAAQRLEQLARYVPSPRVEALVRSWCESAKARTDGYGDAGTESWWGAPATSSAGGWRRIRFAMGHEFAPDAPFGAELIDIEVDNTLSYHRRQGGKHWTGSLQLGERDFDSLCSRLAATPFPGVAKHQRPPGATVVKITADRDGRTDQVEFDGTAWEVAVYDDIVGALTDMVLRARATSEG